MASATPPSPVAPNPGLPKTIGIFNVIIGGLFLLCGVCGMNVFLPGLVKYPDYRLEPQAVEKFAKDAREGMIQDLKRQEQAAGTDAEKAKARQERAEWEATTEKFTEQIDTVRINQSLRRLWLYLWVEVVSGPVLNFLMLVSGVGLILRKNWARVLGIGVALLKIVRLVALCAFATAFVLPGLTRVGDDLVRTELGKSFMKKAQEEQRKQNGGGPAQQLSPEDIVQVLKTGGVASSVFFACAGSVYPVIALVVLTRPGARAACTPRVEPEEEWEQPRGPQSFA